MPVPVRIEELQEGFNATVGPQAVEEKPERLQQDVGIAQSYCRGIYLHLGGENGVEKYKFKRKREKRKEEGE